MIDIKADNHIHTKLCHHASGEMEEYVQAAIDRGLTKINFLEHLELGIRYFEDTWLSRDAFNYYFNEGNRLKEKYKGKLDIGIGVEVGYNPDTLQDILAFLSKHQWDRIGVSYHFMDTGDTYHLNMVSSQQRNIDAARTFGPEKVVRSYYEGLKKAVETIPGNVVCHIDAVLRNLPEITLTDQHFGWIREILAIMVQKDMALEINTSGYKLRNGPYPAKMIISEALKQGIRLEAASDSHHPEQVARYFDRLPSLMRSLRP